MNVLNVSQYNGKKGYKFSYYYNNYFTQMCLIAKSRYKYKNIPIKDIDNRFIENVLFYYGKIGFVKSSSMGIVCAPITDGGMLNNYDIPLSYTFMGNKYNKTHLADNVEVMRGNIDSIPLYSIVSMFAERLANIDMTEDIRMFQLRKPYVFTCKESQRLSVEQLFQGIEDYAKCIVSDKDIETYGINVLDLNVPYDIDKQDEHKSVVWNEFYTFLGINNADNSKRERMVTDEVNANNERLNIITQSEYECRLDACNRINEHFGWNMTVEKVTEDTTKSKQNGSEENE